MGVQALVTHCDTPRINAGPRRGLVACVAGRPPQWFTWEVLGRSSFRVPTCHMSLALQVLPAEKHTQCRLVIATCASTFTTSRMSCLCKFCSAVWTRKPWLLSRYAPQSASALARAFAVLLGGCKKAQDPSDTDAQAFGALVLLAERSVTEFAGGFCQKGC